MNKGILLILDGYGEGKADKYNAVQNAKTPFLHSLKNNSYSLIKTDGEAVGLFEGEMGGSEVGHTTIGAGRVVLSTAKKISTQIKQHKFEKIKTFKTMLNNLKQNNADLHLFGLMSDKNIHSDINHMFRIIEISKDYAKNIFIHFITDGRDCGQFDSLKYLKQVQNVIKNTPNCSILSVSGRFYAMDRENYMERTNLAFNAMFKGENEIASPEKYIRQQHKDGHNDQYVLPAHVKNKNFKQIQKNDYILFFNFREDRLRQIVRKCGELKCNLVSMADVANTKAVALYPSKFIEHTLSEYLSSLGLKQIKISETTKYAHVTYFLNGGQEKPFKNEDRVHVPTIETNDYALTPHMQAEEITKELLKAMKKNYDAIIVNYSNSDMLGHTGNYKATVEALECLDECVKKVVANAKKYGYFVLITADHGNSEQMRTESGQPHTSHTLNKVICTVQNANVKMKKQGGLKDIAPTFIDLMEIEKYPYFKGKSLIV